MTAEQIIFAISAVSKSQNPGPNVVSVCLLCSCCAVASSNVSKSTLWQKVTLHKDQKSPSQAI